MGYMSIGFNFEDPFVSNDYEIKIDVLKQVISALYTKTLIKPWKEKLYFVDGTMSTNVEIEKGVSQEEIESYSAILWCNLFHDRDCFWEWESLENKNEKIKSLVFGKKFREDNKLSIDIEYDEKDIVYYDNENSNLDMFYTENADNEEIVFTVSQNKKFVGEQSDNLLYQ